MSPPAATEPALPPEQVQALRDFLMYGLGDSHLTWWEENFLNGVKDRLRCPAVRLSEAQWAIIRQLQDKLHYDRQDVPLPPIDPDGIAENTDPDGWSEASDAVDNYDEDGLPDWLTAA